MGYRLTVASDDHDLAFLDKFEEAGQLRLSLMHVHLHKPRLVYLLS